MLYFQAVEPRGIASEDPRTRDALNCQKRWCESIVKRSLPLISPEG